MSAAFAVLMLLVRAIITFAWVIAQTIRALPTIVNGAKTYLGVAASVVAGLVLVLSGHPIAGGATLWKAIAVVFTGVTVASMRHALAKVEAKL